MRKRVQRMALAGLTALSIVALPVAQGNAVTIRPVSSTAAAAVDDMVVNVRHGGGHGTRYWKHRNRGGGGWNRHGGNWNHHGHRHGGHGHGGWDDDWWWPGLAGVGVGLGLSLLNPPVYYNQPVYRVAPGINSGHVAWCERRYRSYRAWDNTFKPYHGPRQQCISPYM